MVGHACNPSTQEAAAEESNPICGQHRVHRDRVSGKKLKKKKKGGGSEEQRGWGVAQW
jgi:hypothetical protein